VIAALSAAMFERKEEQSRREKKSERSDNNEDEGAIPKLSLMGEAREEKGMRMRREGWCAFYTQNSPKEGITIKTSPTQL